MKKNSTHYVNNQEFHRALKEYKQEVQDAEAQGKERPRIPDFIGECILKIAQHLSYKANFLGYSFRDEMISDGIENCLLYLDNFNPIKYDNPFAYFTQIIYYAFVRRIQRENRQTLIKAKMISKMALDTFDIQKHDDQGNYTNAYVDFIKTHGVYDDVLEKEAARKAKKKNTPSLQSLFQDSL